MLAEEYHDSLEFGVCHLKMTRYFTNCWYYGGDNKHGDSEDGGYEDGDDSVDIDGTFGDGNADLMC